MIYTRKNHPGARVDAIKYVDADTLAIIRKDYDGPIKLGQYAIWCGLVVVVKDASWFEHRFVWTPEQMELPL